jgi:hypothetical protein
MEPIPHDDSTVNERIRADAYAAAGWRVTAVCCAWLLASIARPDGVEAMRLLTDVALALGGWAALGRARRVGGPEFLRADHWSKILAAPLMLGALLTLLDLWRIFAPAA